MTLIQPAILSTKECHEYCGGRLVFEELLIAHGDVLRPVRTTPRGDSYYRRQTVDLAITQAEITGTLIARPETITALVRNGTRLKRQNISDPRHNKTAAKA